MTAEGDGGHTTVNNTVDIIQICQTLEHRQRDFTDDFDVDGSDFLVDSVERAFVHVFHADADVRVSKEGSVE